MRTYIFPEIADRLGLLSYCEKDYYWVDSIFCEEYDVEHFGSTSQYAKHISVALEHENQAEGSHVEINRLQIYNTPLKVLITYPKNVEQGIRLLEQYAHIISDADIFHDFSTLRKQMVIFAPFRYPSNGKEIMWTYHAYCEGSFIDVL